MGYETRYNLEIYSTEANPTIEDIAADVGMPDYYFTGGDVMKWYNYKQDMLALSWEYPDALFVLKGEGERNGDQWVEYFQNGTTYREEMPEWIPTPFDASRLE